MPAHACSCLFIASPGASIFPCVYTFLLGHPVQGGRQQISSRLNLSVAQAPVDILLFTPHGM
jgi:hypothetical protein